MSNERFENLLAASIVCTLAYVIVAVVTVLLIGLFDARVDNGKIFEIISQTFSMIVGAFVGYLGGRYTTKRSGEKQ